MELSYLDAYYYMLLFEVGFKEDAFKQILNYGYIKKKNN